MSESPPGGSRPSLDSNCEIPTRGDKRISSPDAGVRDSEGGVESGEDGHVGDPVREKLAKTSGTGEKEESDWNRQQKRVYQRTNTFLHYWDSHDYDVVKVELTSSPESDDIEDLSYNHQRLKQTVERARLAYESDGNGRSLAHITDIEHFGIKTNEGPEGKGVLHVFWAWKSINGGHRCSLYVPQDWLAKQWARIHGPHDLYPYGDVRCYENREIDPLNVWIQEVGTEDYHSRENLARYFVSQYLADHESALEQILASYGRSMGGSILEAWEAVKAHTEDLAAAIDAWERAIGGEEIKLSSGNGVNYAVEVEPPPNLGVEFGAVDINPPSDYYQQGPEQTTVTRHAKPLYECDPENDDECPKCGRGAHAVRSASPSYEVRQRDPADRVRYLCICCNTGLAPPGEGDSVTYETEFSNPVDMGSNGPERRKTEADGGD